MSPRTRRVHEVHLDAFDAARLTPLIGDGRVQRLERTAAAACGALAGRVVFSVNSTGHGGGVAEMLRSLLAYVRGAGIDARWLVLDGRDAS